MCGAGLACDWKLCRQLRHKKGTAHLNDPFEVHNPGAPNSLHDVHSGVNNYGRPADDDAPTVVVIVVVTAALIHIAPAAVFPGLSGGQPAIAPSHFPAASPSRRTPVAVVGTVFVPAAALPAIAVAITAPVLIAISAAAMIVLAKMFVAVISFVPVPAVVGHESGSGHS